MSRERLRALRSRFKLTARFIHKSRSLWLRALMCWGIGFALCQFDETTNYDWRYTLRGPQALDSRIVIVNVDAESWSDQPIQNRNLLRALKEFTTISDSFFASPESWNTLLTKILAQKPAAIGVSFYFAPSLTHINEKSVPALYDPRVVWAARIDSDFRLAFPAFAQNYGENTGLIEWREDEDLIYRRFVSSYSQLPQLELRLLQRARIAAHHEKSRIWTNADSQLINFRANSPHLPQIDSQKITADKISEDLFTNKIVLIGSRSSENFLLRTPLGPMGRADVHAQIVDNLLNDRWISRLHPALSAIYLLILVMVTIALLHIYPQTVAFTFLFCLGVATTAASLWVFDAFYFWLPAMSSVAVLVTTYIVFLGYQLNVKENQTWRLEQEKKYSSEVEQLKNNFVSLISHDLKTPIAKIQAICDRLLAGSTPLEAVEGLKSLRQESVELHRYIQSILHISRVESSQLELNKEAIDINAIIERVIDQLTPLAKAKEQIIQANLETMFSVEADSILIQEVIMNLLENAIKYSPKGRCIAVESKEVDGYVKVSIVDNGNGISLEDQARIFEKFYRGQDQAHQTKGSGLGLFLVKYFIELHGGSVSVESALGKGTRVGFSLPV